VAAAWRPHQTSLKAEAAAIIKVIKAAALSGGGIAALAAGVA